jgi:hypothetical protein
MVDSPRALAKGYLQMITSFIISFIKTRIAKNREMILSQAVEIKGFMYLLMKNRNTGEKWTKEEKKQIKQHLKTLALAVPALIVFLPPGGGILLPILVDILDRRKNVRPKTSAEAFPAQVEKSTTISLG